MEKIETLPPPPGIVGSLKAGFDAIASNVIVILLPFALDLFLWLGPRLHIDRIFKPLFDDMNRYAALSGLPSTDLKVLQENSAELLNQLQEYNLLSTLRTYPVGVFSLMSSRMPNQTPFGSPTIIQIDSLANLIGWTMLLTLIGWISGGLFFRWISMVVDSTHETGLYFGQSILQTMLLSILFFVLIIILGIPILLVFAVLISASPLLAQGFLLVLGILSMWLIVPAFFTPHGIFMRQQNAFRSIFTSLKLARFTLPTSSLFVLSVLLIAYGLNFLWNIPTSDSWMVLVGIAGHAFITTSFLAASFIYYKKMQSWLQVVFEKLKEGLPTKQA